jgi:Amt family ammonium transporter
VFGVHGVGGIVGALLTGVLAAGALSATEALPEGLTGLLEGNPGQLMIQVYATVATIIFSGVASLILLKIVDAIVGLRVSEEAERDGLDLSLHGESVQ